MADIPGLDPTAPPSGTGCVECEAVAGWWFHLRRCAECGHIGCCDSSPAQHASAHSSSTGHPLVRSFELAPPEPHPADQPVPGPAGRVPGDWRRQLH
jgi:hypothetical protein